MLQSTQLLTALLLMVLLLTAQQLTSQLPGLLIATAWAGENGSLPGLQVLAVGDLRGEIEPCGCSPEGQMGGLPRRLSYLEEALQQGGNPPLLVDLGNNFPPQSPQGDLKIRLIQELLQTFPPVAILPGPNELAPGLDKLEPALPYLLSNDGVGRAFPPWRRVKRGETSIVLFGYLSPKLVYQKSQHHFRLLPASSELLAFWRRAMRDERPARKVLLFRGGDGELALLRGAGMFDLIIAGNPHDDELNQVTERRVAGAVVPQVPTKGQGLLRINLPSGQDSSAREPVVDWLTGRYADHPAAREPFRRYNQAVKALFFARLQTMDSHRTTSPYAGAKTCGVCHPSAQAVWEKSRHAGALRTLEKVGKQYDPECLACHVVGLERGGFLSKDLTPEMGGVQCENCHGPAKAHLANPPLKPIAVRGSPKSESMPKESLCRTCHVGSHSPTFDFARYWPKIRHGRPAGEPTKRSSR